MTRLKTIGFPATFVAIGLNLLVHTVALANVQGNMDAYWSGSLAAASVTGPTAYQGQSAGYYTAGNFAFRAPQETTQLAAVQMPSVRAGCGGIDIYSGGFSFINSAQLVAMLKSVASNAAGYAFMLAIKALSPAIADQMAELNDLAQKVNQFNIGSCETAQALVASVWGKSDIASDQICQDLGSYSGLFSDRIAARHGCGTGGQRNSTLANLPPDQLKHVPVNKNLAWEAVKGHPLLAADRQLGEMFMTLTGTIISTCPTNTDDTGCVFDVIPAQALDEGTISKFLDGGVIKAHLCDETTRCLYPAKYAQTITIAPASGLRARVTTQLNSLITKIQTRQALSATDQDFLNLVSLPVYKMASVFAAEQGSYAQATMAGYSDLIALDLLYNWIDRAVGQVEDGARNITGVDSNQLEMWRASIAHVHDAIIAEQNGLGVKASAYENMVQRTQRAEQVLAARIGSRVGDSFAFSATLKSN